MFESIIVFIHDYALWIAVGIFFTFAVMITIQLLAKRLAFKMLIEDMNYEDYENYEILQTRSEQRHLA